MGPLAPNSVRCTTKNVESKLSQFDSDWLRLQLHICCRSAEHRWPLKILEHACGQKMPPVHVWAPHTLHPFSNIQSWGGCSGSPPPHPRKYHVFVGWQRTKLTRSPPFDACCNVTKCFLWHTCMLPNLGNTTYKTCCPTESTCSWIRRCI